MQSGGRLVENVERAAGVALGQFERQLDALSFAARKGGGGLPETQVSEADFEQRVQLPRYDRHRRKEAVRLGRGHLQHLVDRSPLVKDVERLAVVAFAVADVAGYVDVGEEMHLDLDDPVALASFAASALHVERETPGIVAARARLGHAREQLSDRREQARVRRRIRARRAADRALVDADHLVELVDARDRRERRGLKRAAVQGTRYRRVKRVVDQRRLPRSGHAGDADEQSDRQVEIRILEVVAARTADAQHFFAWAVAQRRDVDLEQPAQIFSGQRVGICKDGGGQAFGDDAAAGFSRSRAHVDHMVRSEDGLFVMLDHDDRVAQVTQSFKRFEQSCVVALVQADGRLVEHIHYAGEARADLRGEADPLSFAARKCFG